VATPKRKPSDENPDSPHPERNGVHPPNGKSASADAQRYEDEGVTAEPDVTDDAEEVDEECELETDDAIDDPVRMYLMQMGEIPLLSRAQEIEAAKLIELTRGRFRHSMLSTDYVLQAAVAALEKVRDGELNSGSCSASFPM
jgi:RNA polymerase primary sigma factor